MTELHAGNLFWPGTLKNTNQYEPLRQNRKTKVAVIGGGMSGAVCSYVFVRSGLSAIMLDRGRIAGGTTLASTGLVQCSNDIMLTDLIMQIGERDAVVLYKACRDSVNKLASIASGLSHDVELRKRSSLLYASSEQELSKLRHEYETLQAFGFDVEFWSSDDIAARFPFRKPGAIVAHGDAEINPYKFVNTAANDAFRQGLEIYEHTDVTKHETLPNGIHLLQTAEGYVIEAEHVVYAVGYEQDELRGKLIKTNMNRTFVMVTGVQPDLQSWHERFLIWETARPYTYMRTTGDKRVIIGGLDEALGLPVHDERALRARSNTLMLRLQKMFPGLSAPIEYEWSAPFGESRDNLPFIGEDPAWRNVYYCLCYGGNGTVYSMLAAQLLRDRICGETHPLAGIIGLGRRTLVGAE
ncbi:NAD(P)/FAD-dependent oxidoreductase [Paenibacillus harenae]|uniref:NAD(P)/FAD-dependent oxidoreductase n=1 Tax=Paenibacillus harenae TaxID=306543 RepID=UPI00041CAF48|nr:FAD-dependent oxidoreductase [Paenibacillus harenae]